MPKVHENLSTSEDAERRLLAQSDVELQDFQANSGNTYVMYYRRTYNKPIWQTSQSSVKKLGSVLKANWFLVGLLVVIIVSFLWPYPMSSESPIKTSILGKSNNLSSWICCN